MAGSRWLYGEQMAETGVLSSVGRTTRVYYGGKQVALRGTDGRDRCNIVCWTISIGNLTKGG